MGGYLLDFSDRYKKIKVPTQFPRKTRQFSASTDLKASEWRTIAIVAFVTLNEVFDVEEDDHSAKAKKISEFRFFWLMTVKFESRPSQQLGLALLVMHHWHLDIFCCRDLSSERSYYQRRNILISRLKF